MTRALTVIEAQALLATEGGQPVYSGLFAGALRRIAAEEPSYVTIANVGRRADAAYFESIPTARGMEAARAALRTEPQAAGSA